MTFFPHKVCTIFFNTAENTVHSNGSIWTIMIKLAKRSIDTEVVCAHKLAGQRARGSPFLLEMMSGAQRSGRSVSEVSLGQVARI